jgi:hypothetical protein
VHPPGYVETRLLSQSWKISGMFAFGSGTTVGVIFDNAFMTRCAVFLNMSLVASKSMKHISLT